MPGQSGLRTPGAKYYFIIIIIIRQGNSQTV